jgi:hypothetical protein
MTGYGLDNQGVIIEFLMGTRYFCLPYGIKTDSGAHPDLYPMGVRGKFAEA